MGGLIERADALSALEELLRNARGGSGSSLLLSGPAGIGRSALAAHAQEVGRESGFSILSCCSTPVSPALTYGLVRCWLGSLVRTGRPGSPPFDGPASELAEALAAPSPAQPVWNLASLDYALTWTLERLSASRPLLLVLDDVQWLDVGSLQLLDLLSARLPAVPAALLLTQRTGEPAEASEIVDRVAARATKLPLAPLSPAGVEQVRRELAGTRALAEVPTNELHQATGGVPLLVRQVVGSGRLSPPPPEVVDSLRERLTRLGPAALDVARTTAALGEEATFDALAELTGLSVAKLADPLETLADADIVGMGMWRAWPACPVLGEGILTGMAPSERSELHRAVADYLGGLGMPPGVVAGHLLHTLPCEDQEVVELLRSAGEEALAAGSPDAAARHLLRAVGETRPEDTDCGLLALAASAHFLAGRRVEAFDLWSRALDRAPDASVRAHLLADIAEVRMTLGERSEASRAYQHALTTLGEADHGPGSRETRVLVARRDLARTLGDGALLESVTRVDESILRRPPAHDTHADRMLFALTGFDLAVQCESRASSRDLALRALGNGALLAEETSDRSGYYVACAVLSWADAFAESLSALNAAVKDAHQRGSAVGIATASYCRGLVHFRQGRLHQAGGDFRAALELRARGWPHFADAAVAGAALTHVALGEHDKARALEPALRDVGQGHFPAALPLAAAGLVRAAHGDHEQALRDYRGARRAMGAHADNGSITPWREFSVWSLKALGRPDEALDVAQEAVLHARHWGAPRGLGFALRTLAQLTPRDESIALLRESLTEFDVGSCLDYRARAWTDLGRLLLDGRREERAEGVLLLRRALDYGRTNRVPSAVLRATRLLVRAGERVRDPGADPAASLTPGERRVVELAAAGHTNREIAQKLFVTVKAVEWHLSHAYRKLAISSRSELTAALYGEAGPSSSSAM